MLDWISGQVSRAFARKSTVLAPLTGFGIVVMAAMLSAIRLASPVWVTFTLATILGLIVLSILAAYWYFVFKNPDVLRSEHYLLYKKMIERGLIGDDASGLKKLEAEPQLIDAPPNDDEGEDNQ